MHDLLLKWHHDYGPIFRLFILHKCMIVPCDKKLYKQILTNSKTFPKNKSVYNGLRKVLGKRFLGNGLATNTDHNKWFKRRQSINPVFKKSNLVSYLKRMNEITIVWIEKLRRESKYEMSDWFSQVCLDLIAQVGFGFKIENSGVHEDFANILEVMSKEARDPLFMFGFGEGNLRNKTKIAIDKVRLKFRDVITERCRLLQQEGNDNKRDILDHIIFSSVTNDYLNLEDLIDECVTICIAGHETSSHTLSFVLFELLRNEELRDKLLRELMDVCKRRKYQDPREFLHNSDIVDSEFLKNLVHMEEVILEVLRLYPTVSATCRENSEPVILGSYEIPRKSFIVLSLYVLHRSDINFASPLDLDVQHIRNRSLFSYMPFSLGQRACIGRYFAMNEMKIILCHLLSSFTLKPLFSVSKDEDIIILDRSTLCPVNKLLVEIKPVRSGIYK